METALGCGVVGGLVALVAVALVAIVRHAMRRGDERRREERVAALAAAGFRVEPDVELPAEMPDWELVPRSERAAGAIGIERGGAVGWIFDHSRSDGWLGWNEERSSGGESGSVTRTFHHTLVVLRVAGLDLPRMDVLPDLRGELAASMGAAGAGLAGEGHPRSAALFGALQSIVDSFQAREEKPGALELDLPGELNRAFKLWGDDASRIGALFSGRFGARLLEHRGTILSGEGEWLVVTFHVGVEGLTPPKRLPRGLLDAAQTATAASWALALSEAARGG